MLSICVTAKNRSRQLVEGRELALFPRCVESLAAAAREVAEIACELIVTDWHSDDWPLTGWLEAVARPVMTLIVKLDGAFSRGEGLNRAASEARGEQLFFLDADSLLSANVLKRGLDVLNGGGAYFPVVYSYSDPDHAGGWWRHEGFGNCMVSLDVFDRAGGWPEYRQRGKEDNEFHARVAALVPIVREESIGFCHRWHPGDIEWKDRYAAVPEATREERRLVRLAIDELKALLPPGETLVLVDEARFGLETIEGRRALPFLENNGEYAGAPADGASAVAALARMRTLGATHVAVAWPAFWWLDYYSELAAALARDAERVFADDRLIVFKFHPTHERDGK